MPKVKTHRGARKRLTRSASGKLRHAKRNRRHILTKKSSKRKRQLREKKALAPGDQKRIEQLVPYL
jgi:large subunit ribosomal protein L35